MWKEFNSHRIFFVHKHGRRFIVLYTNMAAVTSCENDLFSHADVLKGSSRVPAPRTSADLSGKKRRPITADFQIWEVHFGTWEISRFTL